MAGRTVRIPIDRPHAIDGDIVDISIAVGAVALHLPQFQHGIALRTTEQDARSDFITPGSISPAAVNAYVAVALAADPIRTDWRHLEQWNELDPAKLAVPVLLIQGQFDPNTPSNVQAQSFVRFGNPDRQWVILAGGDHAALLEKMQPAFIAAIINFLERPRGN